MKIDEKKIVNYQPLPKVWMQEAVFGVSEEVEKGNEKYDYENQQSFEDRNERLAIEGRNKFSWSNYYDNTEYN